MKALQRMGMAAIMFMMLSCAQNREDEHTNVVKQGPVQTVSTDTGSMTLEKQKVQYDTMMKNTIARMNIMLHDMDSRYHTMKFSDTAKWQAQRVDFANKIELLQHREDELKATSDHDWLTFRTQSDTAIYALKRRMDKKMMELNLLH